MPSNGIAFVKNHLSFELILQIDDGLGLSFIGEEQFSLLCEAWFLRFSLAYFESNTWWSQFDPTRSIVTSIFGKECCARLVDDNEDTNQFPNRTKDSTPRHQSTKDRHVRMFSDKKIRWLHIDHLLSSRRVNRPRRWGIRTEIDKQGANLLIAVVR